MRRSTDVARTRPDRASTPGRIPSSGVRRLTGMVSALVVSAVAVLVLFGATPAGAAPTSFVGLVPARLLETRVGPGLITADGLHQGVGAIDAGGTYTLPVVGRGGVPATGVAAVALNVTVTNPTDSSYVTAFPAGQFRPNASNLNMTPGATVSNMVTVAVGDGGAIALFNFAGRTDLVVDVLGWFPIGSGFGGLTPARLLETRPGLVTTDAQLQGVGPIGRDAVADVPVLGRGGVPATGVAAVALNVTVTNPTEASFLTVFPSGQTRPTASNLNMAPGATRSNMVIVPVGANGSVSLYNLAGSTDAIVDVLGWFATGPTFGSLSPARLLETRSGEGLITADGLQQGTGPLLADRAVEITVVGRGGVPASGVGAVALNVTATGATAPSFLTVYPATQVRPTASNLNTAPGATVSNMVIVPVGSNGKVAVYNLAGQTDLIVDVLGWFPVADEPPVTTTTTPITSPETRLVNADKFGPNIGQGVGGASGVAVSGDGRYVAFASTSANLVPDDTNGSSDVFVWNLVTGSVFRVSLRANGADVPGDSVEPAISNDGSRVAFHTLAALDPLDTNAKDDVYVVDVGQPSTIRRVSGPTQPGGSEGESTWPSISGGGRYVVFNSTSTNLVAGDTNGHIDVFRRDLDTGTTIRASVGTGPSEGPDVVQGTGGFGSFDPDISDDGRFVVFSSNETSFGQANSAVRHIYVRDIVGGVTTLVTRTPNRQPSAAGEAQDPSISADGAFVMFHSTMSDLVAEDTNLVEDVFRVASNGDGMSRVGLSTFEGRSEGANTMINANGDFVVFSSDAGSALGRQVYRHDVGLVSNVLMSQSTGGVPGNGTSTDAVISADGKVIAFLSTSTNLAGIVTGGTNVYVRILP